MFFGMDIEVFGLLSFVIGLALLAINEGNEGEAVND